MTTPSSSNGVVRRPRDGRPGEGLRLIRVQAHVDRLAVMARRLQRPELIVDRDYLVHEAMAFTAGKGVYGKDAAAKGLPGFDYPKPFWVKPEEGALLTILGYAYTPVAVMQRHAAAMGDQPAANCMDWQDAQEKRVPAGGGSWPQGVVLRFTCTAATTVLWSPDATEPDEDAGPWEAADMPAETAKAPRVTYERDAYTHWLKTGGPEASETPRPDIYRQWFNDQVDRHARLKEADPARGGRLYPMGPRGASVLQLEVTGMRREQVIRCEQQGDRKAVRVELPIVEFRGILRIEDSAGFEALLARGVGKHAPFGLGMLRLAAA